MSREAMKLALEALEGLEALLLSISLTHLIVYGDAEKAITNLQKALANEALDKKAENARELGLDYEPAQPRAWFTVDELNAWAEKKLKENPHWAEQPAPVREDWGPGPHEVHSLPAPQPAQRKPLTDEMVVAAARMLSDRQAAACNVDCGDMWKLHGNDFIDDARAALEAAHGIKENT
jgi:hypothetical protein